MEIGVYDGDNAVDMVKAAKEASPGGIVEYYGFDYFTSYSEAEVYSKLKETGCVYQLFKGDSLETLPRVVDSLPVMDLVFIDGGKSYQEAQSDWECTQRLVHEGSAVFVHNYDFGGVHKMVNGVSRKEYDVEIIRESYEGLVARIGLRKI